VTKEQSGQHVEANLQDRHERLRTKRDRHQPLRRVDIPTAQGTPRPMGISAVEDTRVQDAVREGLVAMYAQDFLDCA
jgi:RNA-directed DNA polymerase